MGQGPPQAAPPPWVHTHSPGEEVVLDLEVQATMEPIHPGVAGPVQRADGLGLDPVRLHARRDVAGEVRDNGLHTIRAVRGVELGTGWHPIR